MTTESTGIPWWVYLIIGLLIVLVLGGIIGFLVYRRLMQDKVFAIKPNGKHTMYIPRVKSCYQKVQRVREIIVFSDSTEVIDLETQRDGFGMGDTNLPTYDN